MTLPLINVGGLQSGLDTNSIIEQLMAVERIPLQQLNVRKDGFEAKENAWTSVLTRFSALRTHVDDLKGPNAFSSFVTASSSNEAAVAVSAGSGATPGTFTFRVNQLATGHQVMMDGDFASPDDLVGAGDFTVTVDGVDHVVTTDADDTLSDLASAITALGAGVGGSVVAIDDSTYRLMLTSHDTGAAAEFSASGDQSGLQQSTTLLQAQNAIIQLGDDPNSVLLSRSSNTVTDVIQGVTLSLAQTSSNPVTITIGRDHEAATAAVQAFVDELNNAVGQLNSLTDYNAESETGGALVGDTTARTLTLGLRSAVSQNFGSLTTAFTFASSVGISLTREGTFEFDSAKFEAALASDYDGVVAFFEGDGTTDGLGGALDTFLDAAEGIDGSIARAQDRWKAQVEFIDDQIERMEDRLVRRESQLIRQFSGLETAMAQLSQMSGALAAALPGLSE